MFNVNLQFHQCFNSYVAYIHGAGNMPTQAVVHQEGAFKYSAIGLKAAFIAVEYRLRWCFYVIVIYFCDTAIFIKTNQSFWKSTDSCVAQCGNRSYMLTFRHWSCSTPARDTPAELYKQGSRPCSLINRGRGKVSSPILQKSQQNGIPLLYFGFVFTILPGSFRSEICFPMT